MSCVEQLWLIGSCLVLSLFTVLSLFPVNLIPAANALDAGVTLWTIALLISEGPAGGGKWELSPGRLHCSLVKRCRKIVAKWPSVSPMHGLERHELRALIGKIMHSSVCDSSLVSELFIPPRLRVHTMGPPFRLPLPELGSGVPAEMGLVPWIYGTDCTHMRKIYPCCQARQYEAQRRANDHNTPGRQPSRCTSADLEKAAWLRQFRSI